MGHAPRMPLDSDFVEDCPYGPGGLLIDELLEVDKEQSMVRVQMPTDRPLPLSQEQRTDPLRHPSHVSGGLMVHMTGMVGFAHAYYVMDLRHADGWIGYGVRIHDARFSALAAQGVPLILQAKATRIRKIREQIFARYIFEFTQGETMVYRGDQTAVWQQVAGPKQG